MEKCGVMKDVLAANNAVAFRMFYRVLILPQSPLGGKVSLIVLAGFLATSVFLLSHLQSEFLYKILCEQRI